MEIGSFCQMKPNFSQMSKADLRAYVLQHRDDDEALKPDRCIAVSLI